MAYRIEFWDDEIDRITSFSPQTGKTIDEMENLNIYPANLFVTDKATLTKAIHDIEHDLVVQVDFLNSIGKHFEAKRLDERVKYDVEMDSGTRLLLRYRKLFPLP